MGGIFFDASRHQAEAQALNVLFGMLSGHVKSEEQLRGRLNQIYSKAVSGEKRVEDCFNYLAPCDILVDVIDADYFDFVFSVSTLEHIPGSVVERFVQKTASVLKNGDVWRPPMP